jgi:hypothetical protein
MNHIPVNICHKIYDILVAHTNAPEGDRSMFVHHYADPDGYKPSEFRCCSRWGMAGKFWWNNDRFYVSARSLVECDHQFDFERECGETDAVNVLLAPIYGEFREYEIRRNILDAIPPMMQYQGALSEQLKILIAVANKIGLQDAADYIARSMEK